MFDLRALSFGGPAAVVTSMGLIVGLDAATAAKGAVIGSVLIVGIADNLTDSLSVHIYQEAERLPQRKAFRTTVANFFARLVAALSFVAILLAVPMPAALYAALAWGFVLLAALSYLLAKLRGANPFAQIWRHSAMAVLVIATSKAIGTWLPELMR